MEMQPEEAIIWRGHPSARSSWPFFLQWGVIALLPVAFAGIFRANGHTMGMAYWKWLVLSLGLLALVLVIDFFRRASVDYTLTTQRIRVRRGILSRSEQSAAIQRVQNVGIHQRLLDRMLGIGTVSFETAATESDTATFRFAGVAKPRELMLRFETYLGQASGVKPLPEPPGQ